MSKFLLRYASMALVSLFTITLGAQTQELAPCGTVDQKSEWLRAYQQRPAGSTPRTDELMFIPIQMHIVGDDNGSGYYSTKVLLEAFCTLNEDFAESNIQFFFAGPTNYINNTNYYDHNFNQGSRMMNQNNVADAINCYVVESPAGNCGYFSPGNDGVALAKNCMDPHDHTWSHEIGHFLSLPHTFFGWEFIDQDVDFDLPVAEVVEGVEIEKVDRSNCNRAGDGFCDTPSDYLSFRWGCNSTGFSNISQVDPNGEEFQSDGSYFMSYGGDACANRFSGEQIDAMRANITERRSELITQAPDNLEAIIIPEATLTTISPLETVTTQTVMVEWEPIPNATKYVVQINPFAIFSIVFNEYIVDEPRVLFDNVIPDKTFFYRVKPFSDQYTCAPFTMPVTFQSGMVTSTYEPLASQTVSLNPNPVSNGLAQLSIDTAIEQGGEWTLYDATGRQLQRQLLSPQNAYRQQAIDVSDLGPGLYYLRILVDNKQLTKKLIVH